MGLQFLNDFLSNDPRLLLEKYSLVVSERCIRLPWPQLNTISSKIDRKCICLTFFVNFKRVISKFNLNFSNVALV